MPTDAITESKMMDKTHVKTHSSFVNVRTQSISDISHRLTKESALPTAKYLSQLEE